MEWNVMELKVWFEGKTLKETPKFYWELSLYCLKIDNKKSVEWGRPPPPGYGKFHTFYFFYFWDLPLHKQQNAPTWSKVLTQNVKLFSIIKILV